MSKPQTTTSDYWAQLGLSSAARTVVMKAMKSCGRSLGEIGAAFGVSKQAVQQRLREAKKGCNQ